MKKYIVIIMAVIMTVFSLSACGTEKSNVNASKSDEKLQANEKLQIVTTIFPEYDWVKEILGERAENADITMLLDNGVDLHSYQPTAADIAKIADCDLFLYVGGESDEWVADALKEATNKNMKVIDLLDTLGNSVKEEEVVEGMEAEEEEDDGEAEEETEYDEHVWLSLKNSKILCKKIAAALTELDKEHADIYQKNLENYTKRLDDLDNSYQKTVENANQKTLLFGDRFPFRYLTDDYGLKYYAAFVGCSAETEASFDTITFLAGKTDELGLKNIMTIEKSDQKIANTIIKNTTNKNQKILTMDSMQSITSEDIKNGAAYLEIMKANQKVLENALQ